jgi:hypothetical protein
MIPRVYVLLLFGFLQVAALTLKVVLAIPAQAAEGAVKHWKFDAGDGMATVQVGVNFALGQ